MTRNIYSDLPLDREEEKKLVQLAQNGDKESFSRLYHCYLKPIYRFSYLKVGNREEAEDLTATIFLKVLKSLPNFSFRSSFKTWLYRIATNTIMDYYRIKYKTKTISLENFLNLEVVSNIQTDLEESSDEIFKSIENEEKVKSILKKLPENYRKVLELRFLKNYTLKETAKEMGTNANNVKILQYRALKKAYEISEES